MWKCGRWQLKPFAWRKHFDNAYFISFIFSLDRTRPAYLSCIDAGRVDDFNFGLARDTIRQTLEFITPYIDAAAVKI